MASEGTVEEARKNSEIIKVVWSSAVKDPTVTTRKGKEPRNLGSQMRTSSEGTWIRDNHMVAE